MKHFKFIPPNFSAQVSDKDDINKKKKTRILFAETKETGIEFLKNRGLEVHKIEDYNFELEWNTKTKKYNDQAIDTCSIGGKYDFEDKWTDLKEYLFDLSNGKCAFCESEVRSTQYGDVEHYRPKAGVSLEPQHPGYYWLAYEPTNYLPSCLICNRTHKKNHFPIAGKRAQKKGDSLETEVPKLLIADDDFWRHVKIYPSTDPQRAGWAEGLDDNGNVTVEILQLNRPDLLNTRINQQKLNRAAIIQAFGLMVFNANPKFLLEFIKSFTNTEPEFYSANKWEINSYYKSLELEPPPPFV